MLKYQRTNTVWIPIGVKIVCIKIVTQNKKYISSNTQNPIFQINEYSTERKQWRE